MKDFISSKIITDKIEEKMQQTKNLNLKIK